MLLGRYNVLTKRPGRHFSGSTISNTRGNWNKSGANRNRFVSDAEYDNTAAQPNGYLHPMAWVMPQVSGGMSSYTTILGIGTISGSGALGVNLESTLAGIGAIVSAGLAGVVPLIATLAGSGAVSAANLVAILAASATLAGTGTVSAGDLTAIAHAVTTLVGTGALAVTINAIGELSADIIIGSTDPLSPQSLAAAVWNAIAAEYVANGSFGEVLQSIVDYDRILREVRDALVPHIWGAS